MSETWFSMGAAGLGRALAAGEIDPCALSEAYLSRIASHPLAERIYARTTRERAQAEAQAAALRIRAGVSRGGLDGVPISWKDNFDSAHVVTEAGSRLLEGRRPSEDATVLAHATFAGLVCLGKTHMSELAFSGLGLNPMTATSPCVNDLDAVAGGSSSGAAASVAFGLAPAAIGTDTGGSVRVPAAWNDLVGLKTSVGRLSGAGVVPLCERFDTIGPLARSVEDCAVILSALGGAADPYAGAEGLQGASLSGLRLAVLDTLAFDDIRPEPAAGFNDAIQRLSQAGARVEHVKFDDLSMAMSLAGILFTAEAWGIWRDDIMAAPERMFAPILERFRSGAEISAADYVAAWRALEVIRANWRKSMAEYDAVLVPTSPILPPNAARLLADEAYYRRENLLALRNTRIANLMDLPAITLPSSQPSCGVQIMGTNMGEAKLLRIAYAAEQVIRA